MAACLLDTSCTVAAVCAWHAEHESAGDQATSGTCGVPRAGGSIAGGGLRRAFTPPAAPPSFPRPSHGLGAPKSVNLVGKAMVPFGRATRRSREKDAVRSAGIAFHHALRSPHLGFAHRVLTSTAASRLGRWRWHASDRKPPNCLCASLSSYRRPARRRGSHGRYMPRPVTPDERWSQTARAARCTTMRRCYDEVVRTTIELPEDLHQRARAIARDTSRSLSATVADLIRRGLGETRAGAPVRDELTGLLVVRLGTPTTSEDVRALEDDEP